MTLSRFAAVSAAAFLLGTGASAQQLLSPATQVGAVESATADFTAYYETDVDGIKLTGRIRGANGNAFAFVATHQDAALQPLLIGFAPLSSDGQGFFSIVVPDGVVSNLALPLQLAGVFMDGNTPTATKPANFQFGTAPDCPEFSFNFAIGDDSELVAGRRMDTQYEDVGIMLSASNARGGGPDVLSLFDSSNPTGGDTDLATPNASGTNNNTALGNLLIIAENNVDSAPVDGLIDTPDDEAQGGSIYFDFTLPAVACELTLVDVDDQPGTEVRFYRNGDLTTPSTVIPVLSLGDGSVQELTFFETDVERMEVFFAGSGAVGGFDVDTCPILLSFDEFQSGEPRGLLAGTIIDDEFADLGVTVSGLNDTPGNPDQVILFDTANITGGDTDLATPQPGAPGNDEALGFVLIIDEDGIDANMDGLVDDPDDEAGGGEIRIDFDEPVTMFSSRVLDVDGIEFDQFILLDGMGNTLATQVVPDMPDGAVQSVSFDVPGVRTVILELGGSGALTRVLYCPDRLLSPGGGGPVTVR
ncbi:MAG: hypothetical protein AAF196_12895 [Planctomycetota bacterium]